MYYYIFADNSQEVDLLRVVRAKNPCELCIYRNFFLTGCQKFAVKTIVYKTSQKNPKKDFSLNINGIFFLLKARELRQSEFLLQNR